MRGARRIRDYYWRYRTPFAIGIFFLILTQGLALTVPRLLRTATDAVIDSDADRVYRAGYALMAVALCGAIVRILSRLFIFNSGRKVEYDMRNDLFDHLEALAPSFYLKMPLGQVMSRMVNDLTQVRLMLGPGLLNLTNTTLVYIVVVPLLFITDPSLAFFSLIFLPALLLLGRRIAKRLYEESADAQDKLAALSAKVQENLSGAMTVRAYRREGDEERTFGELNDRYLEVNMKLARIRGLMFPLMGVAGALGSIVVLYLGGRRIADGTMSVGQFVEFNAYLAALTWPTIALGWMISMWQRGLASMKRINEIFEAEPSIVSGAASPKPLEAGIRIEHLTFTYPGSARPALEDVSAVFEPGETIVIVGRTGSGKSTLLRALARLIEIPRGTVFLDGQDVLDLPLEHVRGALSYAPQDAFLFSRTIYENVSFGKREASEEEVKQAVETANLHPDVANFSEGLDTLVGERGITLSGGQRQRTTLARALLVDPHILLLDDALAAVDTETESRILTALQERKKNQTTIVTTHRLAFASRADRILVLERGRLVEQGSEEELLRLGGIYARMHRRQRLREQIEEKAHSGSDQPAGPLREARST
jgi:ATP-binding cassette, subfamily B, multidrug efflux pump